VVRDKDNGKAYVTKVTLLNGGKRKTDKVEVKTGAKNDRELEIVEGLKEGDRVLIKPGSAAENEYK